MLLPIKEIFWNDIFVGIFLNYMIINYYKGFCSPVKSTTVCNLQTKFFWNENHYLLCTTGVTLGPLLFHIYIYYTWYIHIYNDACQIRMFTHEIWFVDGKNLAFGSHWFTFISLPSCTKCLMGWLNFSLNHCKVASEYHTWWCKPIGWRCTIQSWI